MAKTNPIGVRFDVELLEKVKSADLAASPQKALSVYENAFRQLTERKSSPAKPQEKSENEKATEVHNAEIYEQFRNIQSEQVPASRNTVLGKKSWLAEQAVRIEEIKKQLK